MSQAAKIAAPLVLLAAAGVGTYFFLQRTEPVAPITPEQPPITVLQPVETQQPKAAPVAAEVSTPKPVESIRIAAEPVRGEAYADAPQGVRGRVLLPTGAPASGVAVYLLESTMNDPIKVFLANKTGTITPPAAMATTEANGSFALGVRRPGQTFDVRVVSDEYPEINHQGLKVREDDWITVPDLQLEVGVVVQGRVIEEGTMAPVGGVAVFLADSQQAHTMVATPGRERGLQAETDANGNYRFSNAPRQGLINLSVEAPGYASSPLLNQQIKPDMINEFTIEVVRGQPIAGVVVDAEGKPVPNVAITASGLSAKTPQTAQAVSAGDGAFMFASLREGPYQLLTNAPQFGEAKLTPVLTGDTEVKIVLQERAFAKLRVLGANSQVVKAYKLSLKRHFPNNSLGIGNVPEFQDRRITPADYDGEWAIIRGLPAGEFVFQITDKDHAKTLSAPFSVLTGGPPPEVEVVLTLGGAITGTVIDDRGSPVAGATVSTDMNGALGAGSGFFDLFRTFIPEKHTPTQVKTDSQGRFRITKLAYADYMVRVHHPDYCEGSAVDITLATEGQVVDAGVVQLSRGALVEGVTSVSGMPTGQVKITVTVPQPEVNVSRNSAPESNMSQAQKTQMMFSATAISAGDGTYRLLKRVPPGTYKIHASRQSGSNNPFEMLLDMKQSEQTLVVPPGQDVIRMNFNLEKR
ncbi:MAG: carboxypeptidase regulatory-like domain-containing protein [Planctomycetes bacterium]|nr:carboxypeptidase regulatory-like domain-containing protein [Planctomycetota bacterium]